MITYRKLGGMGRFAAQICQYVGVRLYAEKYGFRYALPGWVGTRIFTDVRPWSPAERFVAHFLPTVQLDDLRSRSRRSRLLAAVGLWQYSSLETLYQEPRDNIDIYGYFTDPFGLELCHANRGRIRGWLAWKPEIESAFRAATRGKTWAGLHIRRGDFVKLGLALPASAYAETVDHVRGNLPLYVATDDTSVKASYTENVLDVHNPLPKLYAYTPGDIFDFWMLQNARIVIGGGSSFAWCAAFLGKDNEYYAPPLTHQWANRTTPPPIELQRL